LYFLFVGPSSGYYIFYSVDFQFILALEHADSSEKQIVFRLLLSPKVNFIFVYRRLLSQK